MFNNLHNGFVQFINRERTLKHLIYLYLGMQFGGVLFSTSHAANNFIGTGLFMLDTRSRVIFSVIFDSLINLHHPKCGAHKQNKKLLFFEATKHLFFSQYYSTNTGHTNIHLHLMAINRCLHYYNIIHTI